MVNTSKLAVFIIVGVILGSLIIMRFYFFESGTQGELAEIPCAEMLSSTLEILGTSTKVVPEQSCELARSIATMTPTNDRYSNIESDPWHYFGRMSILARDDGWMLIFIARSSSNFIPLFSLQHRRGAGWAIIGQFPAEPVLKRLGVWEKIDWNRVKGDETLKVIDAREMGE